MLQRYVKEVFCTSKQSVIVSLYVIGIKYKNSQTKVGKTSNWIKNGIQVFPTV